MSLLARRRAMMGGKKVRKQKATYLGETPEMNSSSNQNTNTLVTLTQPTGITFNYILVISKDRKAYKELAYHQDTLAFVNKGRVSYDATPYSGSYHADNATNSFALVNRASTESIVVAHARMTGTSGTFYGRFPQKFEVYALELPYEEGDIT